MSKFMCFGGEEDESESQQTSSSPRNPNLPFQSIGLGHVSPVD